jgi:hypothetical protein
MSDGMKGMLVGALGGCLAAWSQWQGDAGATVRIVIVAAAIGFGMGYLIGKRRTA